MEDGKIGQIALELRSEKVQRIIGYIPSSLLRYGMFTIALALACLITMACYFPYREVYAGTAIVREYKGLIMQDSIDVPILLHFHNKRLNQASHQPLSLVTERGEITGRLIQLSSTRDTMERQIAICRLALSDFQEFENHALDFRITLSSGSILSYMLGTFSTP